MKEISTYSDANNCIIVAFVTIDYKMIALNWIKGLEQIGVSNYVIICLDKDSLEFLRANNKNAIAASFIEISRTGEKKSFLSRLLTSGQKTYQESDFHILWKKRFEVLIQLLQAGYAVVHSDLDAVWLRNPMLDIVNKNNAYAIISSTVEHKYAFPNVVWKRLGFVCCMGWVYFKPIQMTIDFLERMYVRLGDDQEEFNLMVIEEMEGVEPNKLGWTVHLGEHSLLALNNELIARGPTTDGIYVGHPNSDKEGSTTKEVLSQEGLWFI